MPTRRELLLSGARLGLGGAAYSALGVPGRALASQAGSDRKFIFVFAQGGWDPTRVFADAFDDRAVSMEPGAERGIVGNIAFVDHADRPGVRSFFEANYASTVVFNGVMVRSIAHEICTMLAMTGTTSGMSADWPAAIAGAERDAYTLPHLVLGGPSFPGDLGVAVARTGSNGQLEALSPRRAWSWTDQDLGTLARAPTEGVVDRYMARGAAARTRAARNTSERALVREFEVAQAHLSDMKEPPWSVDFTGGADLDGQIQMAIDVLSMGVSRCITLNTGTGAAWDTHANNDTLQSPLWESTFRGLGQLVKMLRETPGQKEATLADETVVVMLSEMGRTPALNAFLGKDHWPYTSVLLHGAGVAGNRVIGSFDKCYYGRNVDPVSGDDADSGQVLSAEAVGATLLALADLDPAAYGSGVAPICGALA
jgi:uncharacterized protein (DUF1501 family)